MNAIEHALLHNYEIAQQAREEWLAKLREAQSQVALASSKVHEYTGAMNVIAATLEQAKESGDGDQSGEHEPVVDA